jgi:hypothetical protein
MTEATNNQPLKHTVTRYRQPHLTHEQFMNWLIEVHLPLALPVLKNYGILQRALVSN